MAVFLDEILLHIFEYLDAPTLARLSSVCKQWRSIASTPSLWRKLILLRWPSQKFLFEKVSLSCLNWPKVYQDLWTRGNFSPDDMKYFISCRVVGDELTETELREAMFFHMAEIMMKWDIPDFFQQEYDKNPRSFNKNFELFFDTHDLKWTFIDKRREYIDDLFSCKLKTTKLSRYIRPYQVIPSCLMMFRWLCLFRTHVTEETGLTFYRIWRYRLKHRTTGINFEVFDWKAAMSCTLSSGSPTSTAFREDAIELLNILTHPNFIMHPMGVSTYRELSSSPPNIFRRCNSANSSISSSGLTSPRSPVRSFTDFSFDVKRDSKTTRRAADSTTDSDDESDGGYETGYVSNCEDFISSNHWDIEEQHKIQAEVAGMWTVIQNDDLPHQFLKFDLNSCSWEFNDIGCTYPEYWIQGGGMFDFLQNNLSDHGCGIEPIPSCLALYRLVCLLNINARMYASMAEASIWSLHLVHNTTRGILHLKDLNGWFDVSVTLTEDMQNQLREVSDKEEVETVLWCETPKSIPTIDNFTEYVAGDEGSDIDDKGVHGEDYICMTPTQESESEEDSDSESEDSDVECDNIQDKLLSACLTPKPMNEEVDFTCSKPDIQGAACCSGESSHWQPNEVFLYEGLSGISDVVSCREGAWGVGVPSLECGEDFPWDGSYVSETVPSLQEGNNVSDSEASETHSADVSNVSTVEQFKDGVKILLNLVMDEKFAHPYGTIAGSVA